MISKSKVMGNLGSADGAVQRCLDMLRQKQTYYFSVNEFNEFIGKLQKAHESIILAAKEIEGEEDDRDE